MPVTLKQVAAKANCSVMTASGILGNKAHLFRAEMRERVMASAMELGYRPNSSARAVREGRYGNVAVVASTRQHENHLPFFLMEAIEARLASEDLLLLYTRLPEQKLAKDPEFLLKAMRRWSADGLLITYSKGYPKEMLDIIERYSLPSVWLNFKRDHDCVYLEDIYAGRIATERLLAAGHRKIAFVDTMRFDALEDCHYSVRDRQLGYMQAMTNAGLTSQVFAPYPGDDFQETSVRLFEFFKNPDTRPEAAVVYSGRDSMELAVASLEIPRIPTVSFAEQQLLSVVDGFLDTVILPLDEMGEKAVELLLKKIESPRKPLPPVVIRPRFESPAGDTPS